MGHFDAHSCNDNLIYTHRVLTPVPTHQQYHYFGFDQIDGSLLSRAVPPPLGRGVVTVGNKPSIPTPALIPTRISPLPRFPVRQGLPPCSHHSPVPSWGPDAVAFVGKPLGCHFRLPCSRSLPVHPLPITIRPPAPDHYPSSRLSSRHPFVCPLLPLPPYPSLVMALGHDFGISSAVSYTIRSLLWSGSLPIGRDRLARPGIGILFFGAFTIDSRILTK